MNDRKQRVVKTAQQLFIDNGYQATSIQDILEYCGISKGTFYNYFSSKSELLLAIFKLNEAELEKIRTGLMVGRNPSDIEVFINQIEMQLKANRKNKLITLFEEVLISNDAELKQYMEQWRIKNIRWLYHRFIDIFGKAKNPYLLDCAIMFMGILRENIKFYQLANQSNANIGRVVRYTVKRLERIVEEVSESEDQLIQPELLETWLPDCRKTNSAFRKNVLHCIFLLKNMLNNNQNQAKFSDLLEFIEEELLDSKIPRTYLIESALLSLKTAEISEWQTELNQLENVIGEYFNQLTELNE